MITDRNGNIEYVNSAFEKITGYPTSEVIGKNPRFLKSGIHDDGHYEKLWETILRGNPFQTLMVNRRKDGELYYVEKTITPIRDDIGEIVYFVSTDKNVTERKLMEAETEKLRRARAADLENFAYIASHDLQEPLRMITSFLSLLERRCGSVIDETAHEYLHFATDGARRMRNLIEDLLSYSRTGNSTTCYTPVDMTKIFEEALVNLDRGIAESAAVITRDPLPILYGDRTQLVQLFQNLIGNSIKYRGEEPLSIHVGARRDDGHWVFSFRDNGIGIDPAHKDRVFGMFQRFHPRTKYVGTGLGLAICKRIVERHHGTIWFESLLGKGSTFFVRLPIAGENAISPLEVTV